MLDHPLCAAMPSSGGVSAERTQSILQPILLLDNMIIDGRARRREAVRLRLRCPCLDYEAQQQFGHPAMTVVHANRARFDNPQRVVVAARVAMAVLKKPAWLAAHDRGFAARLLTRNGRRPFLVAAGISDRNYLRAMGVRHHPELLEAVFDGLVSLDHAFRMRELALVTRRRIIELPRAEQQDAIDAALERLAKRQLPLPGFRSKSGRAARVFSRTFTHELGHYFAAPRDASERPSTGEDDEQ
ncbi:hypothetical protein AB3X93_10605 [Paraburkholderia sp. BR14262]|uniref:hypothetical protein n=1 Tax=Paraburkholderia sp. BR14262 TaxID=3236999 RepID=UPI0034CE0606